MNPAPATSIWMWRSGRGCPRLRQRFRPAIRHQGRTSWVGISLNWRFPRGQRSRSPGQDAQKGTTRSGACLKPCKLAFGVPLMYEAFLKGKDERVTYVIWSVAGRNLVRSFDSEEEL